ncbi:MAG: cyclic nucleotide-gated ion channel [Alphaproteobacteria bacterium]|nr:cyclic nucleotide-gated ion channel [Alphaproteobacteria bacterium]
MATRWLYDIVEGGAKGSPHGRVFDAVIGSAIVFGTAIGILSTEATLEEWHRLFLIGEALLLVVFSVEYGLRVAVAPLHPSGRFRDGWAGRLRYLVTPMAVIDLLSILPGLLTLLSDPSTEMLLLLRCVRLLKLLRFFSAFDTLIVVVRDNRKPLLASSVLMLILLVIISSLAHLVEAAGQPEAFGSVPRAMWWGIVTLATVGYGDVVPLTPLGRVLGSLAVLLGMGMFALPAGILATGFAEEMKRRNFVVSWSLVAKVPFFESLPATRIAEIVTVLEPRSAERGELIIEVGDPADGMYFLIEGEVEVQLPDGRKIGLADGDFFGEIALLSAKPRMATIAAKSFCQLLKLRVDHFHRLMAENADLADRMRTIAAARGLDS